MRRFESAVAIGKQQHRVAMHLPEAAEAIQRRCRQRHQAVFVAFGIANMRPLPRGIDIGHRQAQAFAETQPQAIKCKKEHPITEGMVIANSRRASSTVTMSGKRCALGGLINLSSVQGLFKT